MPALLSLDFVTGLISFLLTLMILSYLIGDNPAFRIAVYLFVGVSAGYAAVIAWHQVLWPMLFVPLLTGTFAVRLLAVIPLLLGVMLLMKLSHHTSRIGNVAIAFLVGVGAAVAVGGAVLGTLFPQTAAAVNLPSLGEAVASLGTDNAAFDRLLEGLFILLGTVSTLIYFQFSAKPTPAGPRQGKIVRIGSWVGQVFIAITFGVLFAGVLVAALTSMIERINSLVQFIGQLPTLF
jgi:hypothetical protein